MKNRFLEWCRRLLQPIVERKFRLQDTWQLEKVQHKTIKLPYVLLENHSFLINTFWIPIRLVDIRLDVFNKDLKVGKILYDNHIKVAPRSQQPITLEVRLSHITAMFNLLRFVLVNTITMEVKGEVHIRLFGMDFFLPVHDFIDIPKSKFQLLREPNPLDKSISDLPYEDIIPESDIESEWPPELHAELQHDVATDLNVVDDPSLSIEDKISDEHTPK